MRQIEQRHEQSNPLQKRTCPSRTLQLDATERRSKLDFTEILSALLIQHLINYASLMVVGRQLQPNPDLMHSWMSLPLAWESFKKIGFGIVSDRLTGSVVPFISGMTV